MQSGPNFNPTPNNMMSVTSEVSSSRMSVNKVLKSNSPKGSPHISFSIGVSDIAFFAPISTPSAQIWTVCRRSLYEADVRDHVRRNQTGGGYTVTLDEKEWSIVCDHLTVLMITLSEV